VQGINDDHVRKCVIHLNEFERIGRLQLAWGGSGDGSGGFGTETPSGDMPVVKRAEPSNHTAARWRGNRRFAATMYDQTVDFFHWAPRLDRVAGLDGLGN
jgi:hypothetical protein